MFQAFEWNVPSDGKHWKRLTEELPVLKAIGIDNIWLPPGCKAGSSWSNGYDIYDLYDLGEFDQKCGKATKWGVKEDLIELTARAKDLGIGVYWDAVLNHKAAADRTEKCMAVEVDPKNRMKEISKPYEIEAWLAFDFPGRRDEHSPMKYHWFHFSGTDYNAANRRSAIYRICGENKGWSPYVSKENGNADYLMFADVDYSNREVCDDVKRWAVWIVKELGLKGFRLDAVRHFSARFTKELVDHLNGELNQDVFIVGEYWVNNAEELTEWLSKMKHKLSLFDAPLLYNFSKISKSKKADLRKVFENSLVQVAPSNAVTIVMNHDTQPGQTVATPIKDFFKPLAYSLILLRKEGYPCPFYGDLYGTGPNKWSGTPKVPPSCGNKLADIILARKLYAYGKQEDYWDEPNCIGWVRKGTWDRPDGCAVLMSNDGPGRKKMHLGDRHKGEIWTDLLGWETGVVKIDNRGFGVFRCPRCSVAIWVNKKAHGRDKFPVNFNADIYKMRT